MFLGAWVAAQSFLGFPLKWDEVTFVILGICIVGLGMLIRRDRQQHQAVHHAETFVEHMPEQADAAPAVADAETA